MKDLPLLSFLAVIHELDRCVLLAQGLRGRSERGESGEAMGNLIKPTNAFLECDDGPTATEYAVMLVLIIMVGLMAVSSHGSCVTAVFTEITSGFGG